jgi:hypothetical protein
MASGQAGYVSGNVNSRVIRLFGLLAASFFQLPALF